VDLVEDPQLPRGKLAPQDALAMLDRVPVQIPRPRARQGKRQRGLADLARPGDEHHLAREVAPDRAGEVTRAAGRHAGTLPKYLLGRKNISREFCYCARISEAKPARLAERFYRVDRSR